MLTEIEEATILLTGPKVYLEMIEGNIMSAEPRYRQFLLRANFNHIKEVVALFGTDHPEVDAWIRSISRFDTEFGRLWITSVPIGEIYKNEH